MSQARFLAMANAAGIEATIHRGFVHPRTFEIRGWHIELDAPEGKWFAGSATSVDCSLQGECVGVDWKQAISGLRQIIADGFMDAEDEE